MSEHSLSEWVETSPEQVCAFRLLLGERGEMNTLGIGALIEGMDRKFPRYSVTVSPDLVEAAEEISAMADAGGYGTEHATLGVIAVGEDGRQVTSWQRTIPLSYEGEETHDPTAAMAEALIRAMGEVRRCLRVVTDGHVEAQERHDDAIARMIEAQTEHADTAAELELVTTLSEIPDAQNPGDPMEEAAAAVMEQVAASLVGRPQQTLSPAEAKHLLMTQPGMLQALVADPEIVGVVMNAMKPEPVDELVTTGLVDETSEPPTPAPVVDEP